MPATDATQQRLLQAAGEVFAEKGFQAATVREICARAEVNNIAAVNYYFGDKESLYEEALRAAASCGLSGSLPLEWPASAPPALRLQMLIRGLIEKVVLSDVDRPRWHMQLMMRELSQPSAAGVRFVREFIRPVYEQLWSILREVLPKDTPEKQLHLVAFSIVGQCLYHRLARPVIQLLVGEGEQRSYTAHVLSEHIIGFSCRALGLQPVHSGEEVAP